MVADGRDVGRVVGEERRSGRARQFSFPVAGRGRYRGIVEPEGASSDEKLFGAAPRERSGRRSSLDIEGSLQRPLRRIWLAVP